MKVARSDELKEHIRFAADPEAQTADNMVTLTLQDVYQIAGEAQIGRFPDTVEDARRIKRPAKKKVGASFGSWDLVQGAYWVTYNEMVQIPEGAVLYLENHPSLARNGVWQATRIVTSWKDVSGTLLMVGAKGVRLFEGSPVSVCLMIRS